MSGIVTDAVPDPRSYKLILKEFSDSLSKRDLSIIKFLCADIIPASELEKIDRGFGVWKSLEDKGYLGPNDCTLLTEILYLGGRIDLVLKLSPDTKKVGNRIKRGDTLLSPFRVLLCKLGLEIPQPVFEGVKYVFSDQLSKSAREDAKDMWAFFLLLEKQDLLAPGHVDCLQDIIDATGRPGLKKLVDEYNESGGGKAEKNYAEFEQAFIRDANWKLSDLGLREIDANDRGTGPPLFYPIQTSDEFNQQRLPEPKIQQQVWPSAAEVYSHPHHAGNKMPSSRQKHPHDEIRGSHQQSAVEISQIHSDVSNLRRQPAPAHSQLVNMTMTHTSSNDADPLFYTKGIVCHPSGECSASSSQRKQQAQSIPSYGKTALAVRQQSEMKQPRNTREEAVEPSLQELPAYKMTAMPRGPCIIINNQTFIDNPDKKARKLENRPGSKVDEENLKATFKRLGFEVFVYIDCTVKRMEDIFLKFAKDNYRLAKSDALVVIILSHGKFGAVYGTDCYEMKIVKILEQFRPNQCPELLDKPKLFFVQACQGREKQTALRKLYTDDVREEEDDLMPQDADFFIGYATIPGYVSYRHEDEGSWYISTLVEHLNKYARKYDLLSIMTEVNRCVARRTVIDEENRYKQLPLPYTTLTKKVYFK